MKNLLGKPLTELSEVALGKFYNYQTIPNSSSSILY